MFFKKILKSFSEKQQPKQEPVKISRSLTKNIELVKELLNSPDDLKIRILDNGEACLLYLESLTINEKIQQNIFQPIYLKEVSDYSDLDYGNQIYKIDEIGQSLLKGHAIILQNDKHYGFTFNVLNTKFRDVQEPTNELVIRGAHDGFIEDIATNINLIRKRIENYNLVVKYYTKGTETNTKIAVVYLKGIASEDNVKEVDRRLNSIDGDMIISPGYIEEFIEDTPMSPFPQILSTERPDRTIANILEGRIAILSEGSPSCLIAPVSFFAFYQSPDDYNSRWISGTFLRLIRLTSFLIAIGLPSVYIAIIGFHFEVIPHDLIIPIKASINEIPYPPIIEALMMVVVIELIREAGIRLPAPIGQTIGIVGGLVIGDAVVKAGLVSNLMVVIIALTAIASFVVPSNEMSNTLRILTFPLILLAGTFGFVGIAIGFLVLTIHLSRLESLGAPYFAPVSPLFVRDLKDTFLRLPIYKLNRRPRDVRAQKSVVIERSREWDQNEE